MADRIATVTLAALPAGLLTPLACIGIGAMAGFAPAFPLLALPACGVLLHRHVLHSTPASPARPFLAGLVETAAWLGVGLFLSLVSGFNLHAGGERMGLFATLLLASAGVAAPWMALRPTALVARIAGWPKVAVRTATAVASVLLATLAAVWLATPARLFWRHAAAYRPQAVSGTRRSCARCAGSGARHGGAPHAPAPATRCHCRPGPGRAGSSHGPRGPRPAR